MLKIYFVRYAIGILCLSSSLCADVISPTVQAARDRLSNNPNVYDRVDNFCQGKKPRDACTIIGSVISGGGEGVCSNAPKDSDIIDLRCIRTNHVDIYRAIPDGENQSDRFCKGKKVGSSCKIEFTYDYQTQTAPGTCNIEIETTRYYYQGYHEKSRSTIQCQPKPLPARTYTPVSLFKKLIQ
ncbi:MAG: hypothetical protein WC680_10205 [Sulfuricurvum sp.]|jgi:hypothetical protein